MIVRALEDRCLLITQPDHAHLARSVMEHCVALAGHPRRESILFATGEHDAAWAEEDAAPMVHPETGEILDFIQVPLSVRQGVWARTLARLASDPWATALVAHHAVTVYDRFRADADWSAFFAALEDARETQLRAAGGSLTTLAEDYPFVRLGDLISLTFCTAAAAEQRFGDWSIRLAGSRVVVEPDPFGEREIAFEVAAKELPARRFGSDRELREVLRRAPAVALRGAAGRSPG